MKVTDKYVMFFTYNDIYSNWYKSAMTYSGFMFYTNEQYVMYQKAKLFGDNLIADLILNTRGGNPKECKALGRKIKGFDEAVWIENRKTIMKDGIYLKAKYNKDLMQLLVMHHREGRKFVEASPYDKIWGVGFNDETAEANVDKWGLNLLGECYDEVAKQLSERGITSW